MPIELMIRKAAPSVLALILLTGCSSSVFEAKIKETEIKNQKVIEEKSHNQVETPSNNESISDKQKEVLEKLDENTKEDALFKNDLDLRRELNIKVPEHKEGYKDPNEFSQYISYLFFAYHSGKMSAEEFTNLIIPQSHENFINMLPREKGNQIESFSVLQAQFKKVIAAPIKNYSLTELEKQDRFQEASFYRKYELENGEFIYYITVIKEKNGIWKLYDDSPAPPYVTNK
ncbi:hypothetical protein [Bacillus cihuensis]|uniref:hypothetical protein n=1 Tax=Bacillus cihuensis TaxID=1208599 RepID=UPI00041042B6|nr:hypothetical protein [Bacillus cihuensis]